MDREMENLTIGAACSSEVTSGDPMPTPGTQDSEARGFENDDITASWTYAIQHCWEHLSDHDFEKMRSFSTSDLLLEDLKGKETEKPNLFHFRRPFRTMKSFLAFFVVTMSPRDLKSSIFWGLLYLLVDLSVEQKDINNRLQNTLEMLEKITKSLGLCRRAHENSPFDDVMKLTLNDAFIALITLWAGTVNIMRNSPYVVDGSDEVQSKFMQAITKVDDTFQYLKLCASNKIWL